MPDFIVRLDGVKLSKEQQNNINREFNNVVMRELARTDMLADISIRFPKEWLGIWIRNKQLERLNINLKVQEIEVNVG